MKRFAKSIALSLTIFYLSLLVYNLADSSEPTAVELLKKSYANQRSVSHTGMLKTVVFPEAKTSDERNTSIVDIRQKDGKMRMDYKSGIFAGLSIIDDGEKMMRLNRKNRAVAISPIPFPQDDVSLLLSNYEIILKGTEEIAGRQTQILEVKPFKSYNPAKKLWIDTETFMPLKKEHYNSDGVLATLTFYTQISYDTKIKEKDFSVPKDWRVVEAPRKMRKLAKKKIAEIVGFDVVEPKYMPEGYVLDGFYLFHPMPRDRGVHIRYVDGINSISVFEILPPWPRRLMHRFRRGFGRGSQMNRGMGRMRRHAEGPRWLHGIQGKRIRATSGDLNIIIVSDIAEAELQKIADSF
jgi:outer membrane lipoprotein-sorting protein